MKIFDFNSGGRGSYLDKVSGTQGVSINGRFRKTEKQYAWLGNGVGTYIKTNHISTSPSVFTFAFIINAKDGNRWNRIIAHDGFSLEIAISDLGNISIYDTISWKEFTDQSITFNNFNFVTVSYDGTNYNVSVDNNVETLIVGTNTTSGEMYIGSSAAHTAPNDFFNGHIKSVELYNTVLTTTERNNLYADFLRSKGTGSSIHKNGFPIKAEDLSRLDGLVFASNMIPSSGGVLVDTSGNGNNNTIRQIISTKNGMASNRGQEGTEFTTPITISRNNGSLCFRIKVNSVTISGSYASLNFIAHNDIKFQSNIIIDTISRLAVEGTTNSDYWVSVIDNILIELKQETSICISANSGTVTTYVNGINIVENTPNSDLILSKLFGSQSISDILSDVEIQDFRIGNRPLSIQEIKDYHNQFVKPVIIEDFQQEPVGEFPVEWQ